MKKVKAFLKVDIWELHSTQLLKFFFSKDSLKIYIVSKVMSGALVQYCTKCSQEDTSLKTQK